MLRLRAGHVNELVRCPSRSAGGGDRGTRCSLNRSGELRWACKRNRYQRIGSAEKRRGRKTNGIACGGDLGKSGGGVNEPARNNGKEGNKWTHKMTFLHWEPA